MFVLGTLFLTTLVFISMLFKVRRTGRKVREVGNFRSRSFGDTLALGRAGRNRIRTSILKGSLSDRSLRRGGRGLRRVGTCGFFSSLKGDVSRNLSRLARGSITFVASLVAKG